MFTLTEIAEVILKAETIITHLGSLSATATITTTTQMELAHSIKGNTLGAVASRLEGLRTAMNATTITTMEIVDTILKGTAIAVAIAKTPRFIAERLAGHMMGATGVIPSRVQKVDCRQATAGLESWRFTFQNSAIRIGMVTKSMLNTQTEVVGLMTAF